MAAESAPPAWVVTQQIETTDVGPSGGYVAGVRVTFRTAGGVAGSVFVDHGSYTVAAVKAAIDARAAVLDAVASLGG